MPPHVSHPDILPSDPKAFAALQTDAAVRSFFGPFGGFPAPAPTYPRRKAAPPARANTAKTPRNNEARLTQETALEKTYKYWANEAVDLLRQASRILGIEDRLFKGIVLIDDCAYAGRAATGRKLYKKILNIAPAKQLTGPDVRELLFAAFWRLSRVGASYRTVPTMASSTAL